MSDEEQYKMEGTVFLKSGQSINFYKEDTASVCEKFINNLSKCSEPGKFGYFPNDGGAFYIAEGQLAGFVYTKEVVQ